MPRPRTSMRHIREVLRLSGAEHLQRSLHSGDKIQIVDPDVADQRNLPRADHWNSPGLSSRIGPSRSSTSASSRPGRRGIELGRALATAAHPARHTGTRGHATTLRTETASALAPVGLRLSETKTRIVQIDGGSGVLGFYVRRHQNRGTARRFTLRIQRLNDALNSDWPLKRSWADLFDEYSRKLVSGSLL